MTLTLAVALLLLALLGHGLLWVALINRMHATGIPRRLCKALTRLAMLCAALIMLAFWRGPLVGPIAILAGSPWFGVSPLGAFYVGLCWVAGVVALADWWRRHVRARPPAVLRWHRSRLHALARPPAAGPPDPDHEHHFLARLPGNQMLVLDVVERALEVRRLPASLEGLRIAHLSDLHFTGAIGKGYFQEVVRHSNDFAPDVVAVTGDLVDNDDCIAWIPDTLGRLTSRHGVFFVLGNHDLWVDTDRLRRTVIECGLTYLGSRWLEIPIRGEAVVLAGNELPWFSPAADLSGAPPRSADGRPLRLVLAHSPDQLRWAQSWDVDLMLAGHTHGGQVRFPWIGPIFAPSRAGVKYASGTFHAPPTVMHVSRGLSGEFPLRLNCPPELGLLTLHGQTADRSS
jgi:predicted MPP superfamily phosphohydrolase